MHKTLTVEKKLISSLIFGFRGPVVGLELLSRFSSDRPQTSRRIIISTDLDQPVIWLDQFSRFRDGPAVFLNYG